ncbi:hypothetical protein GGD52_002708 [Agrobacterium tumefaciens]|nr:hypothetical protein [Agrobacterium radiobacter]MBB5588115.1 hypothetical protein [Agrobacterium radiobacter]
MLKAGNIRCTTKQTVIQRRHIRTHIHRNLQHQINLPNKKNEPL